MSAAADVAVASDAAAIEALERLQATRTRLHDALREAAFSFVAAQREEETSRGCLVAFDAVPTADNTLVPLLTVSRTAGEEGGGEDSAAAAVGSSWVLTETPGGPKPAVGSRRAAATSTTPSAAGEGAAPTVDPAYYFSEHPSAALRECQAAYRRVLQCVMEVAGAQECAVAAATKYAELA